MHASHNDLSGILKPTESEKMKPLYLILTTLLVSSCTSISSKEDAPITQYIQFLGAQNDLTPKLGQLPQILKEPLIHQDGVRLIKFPLTYAVECNTTKTYCKHAVVKTELEFTAQATNKHSVKLSGVLRSEMGRSLSMSITSSSSYTQTMSQSVPNEVDVIAESKVDQHFDRELQFGEKLELRGFAGVQVDIEFQ